MKIGQVHFLMYYDKNVRFCTIFLWHPFLGNKTNLFVCMYVCMYVCILYVLDSSWEISWEIVGERKAMEGLKVASPQST